LHKEGKKKTIFVKQIPNFSYVNLYILIFK